MITCQESIFVEERKFGYPSVVGFSFRSVYSATKGYTMENGTHCDGDGKEMARFSQTSISDLPEELLLSIISCLTMNEAARTSVLATRWRYLWIYSCNFNLDGWEIMRYLGDRMKPNTRPRFVNLVNQVVMLNHSRMIEQFRIRFMLEPSFSHDIDRWLKFAFAKRVKTLEIDFAVHPFGVNPGGNLYPFPDICHPIKCLDFLPFGLATFNRLENLSLKHILVSGEVLEYFIANCPNLEVLNITDSRSLSSLRIFGPCLRLKYLEICYCGNISQLEISAPNLVSFVYIGPKISLDLKNVPLLIMSTLGTYRSGPDFIYNFGQFAVCFAQLETLTLRCHFEHQGSEFSTLRDLPRLKKLVVHVRADSYGSLLGLTSLLNAAPSLCEFKLMLICNGKDVQRQFRRFPRYPHQCLKLVEIVGFVGRQIDMELITYLLENAVSLEKMIIDPRNAVGVQFPVGFPVQLKDTPEIFRARERAQMLKETLEISSVGVDVHIL